MIWEQWKKGFEAWENRTANLMEGVLKTPLVLQPMGAMMTATMKLKSLRDKGLTGWWSSVGLPTRRDQERTLHALNQLNSRLLDLEEKLQQLDRRA